jgi:hypothetical protein
MSLRSFTGREMEGLSEEPEGKKYIIRILRILRASIEMKWLMAVSVKRKCPNFMHGNRA